MKLQIIYPESAFKPSTIDFHNGLLDEIEGFRQVGLNATSKADLETEKLLLRTTAIYREEDFPSDRRYISKWRDYESTMRISLYLPLIDDISIPTFLCDKLDVHTVNEIKRRGWKRVFVRSDVKSLKFLFPESNTEGQLPVWPDVSISHLADAYANYHEYMPAPYAVRKFISDDIMLQEKRYWIINNHAYHRSGIIPHIVTEAVERLKPLKAPYYVIDATPSMIVEVNPGASSDAYPENLPELFPKWIKKEFGG